MAKSLNNFEPAMLPLTAIKPLDFNQHLSSLPPTHTWPLNSIRNHDILDSIDVPIIDLENPDLDQIKTACEEYGIFTIKNHGISEKLLEDFRRETMELFALPMEAKHKVLRSPKDHSGYGGVPVAIFAPRRLWHEGFGIKKLETMHEHASKLWPPHGNPKFCRVMEDYQQEMKTLSEKILTLMLASVALTPDDTNWAEPKTKEHPFGPNTIHLLLNSYPPCPDPDQAMGMAQHTDSSIITLVNQVNNVSGLQVLLKDKWANVKPVPGTFVVNSGDLAHFFFNGQFVSPVHRVVPSQGVHRYSAAYVYRPPFEAVVAPLPKLMGPDHEPMYYTFTWKNYVAAKYNVGYKNSDKVFEFIRVKKEENRDVNECK